MHTGAPVPALSLVDDQGEIWQLSQHRGCPVVLIFHRHLM